MIGPSRLFGIGDLETSDVNPWSSLSHSGKHEWPFFRTWFRVVRVFQGSVRILLIIVVKHLPVGLLGLAAWKYVSRAWQGRSWMRKLAYSHTAVRPWAQEHRAGSRRIASIRRVMWSHKLWPNSSITVLCSLLSLFRRATAGPRTVHQCSIPLLVIVFLNVHIYLQNPNDSIWAQ